MTGNHPKQPCEWRKKERNDKPPKVRAARVLCHDRYILNYAVDASHIHNPSGVCQCGHVGCITPTEKESVCPIAKSPHIVHTHYPEQGRGWGKC